MNPLLSMEFRVAFDRIRAEHVEPAIGELLEGARGRMEALAAGGGDALRGLDSFTEHLDWAMGVVRHLEAVSTYPELRAARNAVEPPASAFYASIFLHEGLWRQLKQYPGDGLWGSWRRYLTKSIDNFRRHGAELPPEDKARLQAIDVELAQLTTRFSEHVLDSTNDWDLVLTDERQLAGLPPSARAAARQAAEARKSEGWRFTLQAPSYLAVMTYLDDECIRRQVYDAYTTRAAGDPWDNRALIPRILDLRRQKAHLLGYSSFADFVLEDRMAHSGAKARAFLDELRARTEEHFRRENRGLLAFRRHVEGPGAPELQPWDVGYWAEKQRKALYDFDEEALRPYFPLERVAAGLFDIAGRLFGIRVVEEPGVPAWDPEVKYYRVENAAGHFLGGFYADWYPRENKRDGAWMDALLTGRPEDGRFKPHLALICGNLTRPLSDRPALLTHREVETIFHEFGHLLHHLLSQVEVRSLAGTNVAWDFVELPSQIMENWCWEREALDLLARHWQTGDTIPEDLFQNMRRARTFRAANAQMRQLGFAFTDLALHIDYQPARDGGVVEYTRSLLQQFSPAPLPPHHAMIAAFTHLFGSPVGYAAAYYSYKWSEVLDADAFTRFRAAGVFNREVGAEFRDKILARGDSDDPAALYRDFMGRDPDPSALLERLGLTPRP